MPTIRELPTPECYAAPPLSGGIWIDEKLVCSHEMSKTRQMRRDPHRLIDVNSSRCGNKQRLEVRADRREFARRLEIATAGHFQAGQLGRLGRPWIWQRYFDAVKARDQIVAKVPNGGSKNEYWEGVRVAVQGSLSAERIDLILEEEAKAWRIGRELLEARDFDDFAYYEAETSKRLHYERYRLGRDPLWPEDKVRSAEFRRRQSA